MNVEYLLLLPIGSLEMGSRFEDGEDLPLHCTLMHWFRPGPYLVFDQFDDWLLAIARVQEYLTLESREPALFGPQNKTPVHVLMPNERLGLLHTTTLLFLAKHDSLPDELRWIGGGYRAHVTDLEGVTFPPGSKHRASRIVLVERDLNSRRKLVKGIYPILG